VLKEIWISPKAQFQIETCPTHSLDGLPARRYASGLLLLALFLSVSDNSGVLWTDRGGFWQEGFLPPINAV